MFGSPDDVKSLHEYERGVGGYALTVPYFNPPRVACRILGLTYDDRHHSGHPMFREDLTLAKIRERIEMAKRNGGD